MLLDITAVKALSNLTLYLKFEDGLEGNVDLKDLIEFTGVFEPLTDELYFAKVKLNEETGTIYWPNQADICSDVLYAKLSGKTIDQLLANKSVS